MTQYNNTQIVQWYLQCNSTYINNVMSNITSIDTLQGSIPIHGNPLHTICFWQSAMIQNVFWNKKKTKRFLMGVVWPEMTGPGPPDEAFVGGKVAFGLGGEVMWHHATNPNRGPKPRLRWNGRWDAKWRLYPPRLFERKLHFESKEAQKKRIDANVSILYCLVLYRFHPFLSVWTKMTSIANIRFLSLADVLVSILPV